MLDSKYITLFLGGFVLWMIFIVAVGFFGSRGKRDGQKFLTGGSDMNLFLIFCTLGATIIGTGSSIGAIGDGFSHGWGGAMLMGRLWKRATWQGALATIFTGTAFGVVIVCVPPFADWVKSVFGGPAIPATVLSLAANVVVSLLTPRDLSSEEDCAKAVFAFREGTSV